jgi:multiple RNA-binding domain-containing protein 1
MDAVQGAHLYGRRLLLEWAEEEGGLDELRAKTGRCASLGYLADGLAGQHAALKRP